LKIFLALFYYAGVDYLGLNSNGKNRHKVKAVHCVRQKESNVLHKIMGKNKDIERPNMGLKWPEKG